MTHYFIAVSKTGRKPGENRELRVSTGLPGQINRELGLPVFWQKTEGQGKPGEISVKPGARPRPPRVASTFQPIRPIVLRILARCAAAQPDA